MSSHSIKQNNKPYSGKILWVDLSTGKFNEEIVPDEVYERFLSGMGLAVHVLYPRIPAGADALGEENILGFVSGLLTGTGSLYTGRWLVAAKSPLTGTWGDANCGGNFAPAIKQCGYDGIFFKGISPQPVYLSITPSGPELCDASHLWGKDAVDTEQQLLREAQGQKKPAVACIGSGGEKLSLISGIVNDGGRIAARSGLGAVMGSKRLKAVVLNGARRVGVAKPDRMRALSISCNQVAQINVPLPAGSHLRFIGALLRIIPFNVRFHGILFTLLLKKWGTIGMNQASVEMGDSPIMNWKGTNLDYQDALSRAIEPGRIIEEEKRKYHCYACPIGCGGVCHDGDSGESHKLEYESSMAFGGMLLNTDLDSIRRIVEKLNRAGMDSISTGGTVAFALEAYERGHITLKDTDGLELTWGNAPAIEALVDKIIQREGIGDLLADGVKQAARRFGNGASEYAIHAGGQEIAFHDPRNDAGYAIHASVEPTPGRHTTGSMMYYDMYRLWKRLKSLPRPNLVYAKNAKFKPTPDTINKIVANSDFTQMYNGAGVCMFGAFLGVDSFPIFEWLNAATGWNKTPEEYMEIGRRVQTMRQMFNIRHGIDPHTLKINPRALGIPALKHGANRGNTIDIEAMMFAYWQACGWDAETGIPTQATLAHLGILDRVIEETKE